MNYETKIKKKLSTLCFIIDIAEPHSQLNSELSRIGETVLIMFNVCFYFFSECIDRVLSHHDIFIKNTKVGVRKIRKLLK